MDSNRLLSPLDSERAAVRRLSEYASADELADAIRRVEPAIQRVLRLILREDRSVPDPVRMTALSGEMTAEEVVVRLRRADTISMELATRLAELRDAAGRARDGTVTAADADVVRDVIRQLTEAATGPDAPPDPAGATPGSPEPVTDRAGAKASRVLLVAAFLIVAGGATAWIALRDRARSTAGVTAFTAGRMAEAERVFRARTQAGRGSVTDWLFLGRIYRRMGRFEDAAGALRTAVDADPADADVRRELGWLFMDLDRPAAAAEQFRLAVEAAPDESLGWIGLIRALREAADPAADDWLRRAPADARSRLDPAEAGPPAARRPMAQP